MADGGPLNGGAPRAVWLTLGAGPRPVSVHSAAQALNQGGCPCHIVWDPATGDIAQLIPVVRAARALGAPERLERVREGRRHQHARTNREGRVCVQICVLGPADVPFTAGPMKGLAAIMEWLDSWEIPRSWPAGRPVRAGAEATRSRALWARGGYFGASQVPDCDSRGPGEIDIERLTGTHLVSVPVVEVRQTPPVRFDPVRTDELALSR